MGGRNRGYSADDPVLQRRDACGRDGTDRRRRRAGEPGSSGIPRSGRENVMGRFMITDRAMINRRTAVGGALVALSPLAFPGRAMAQGKAVPSDSFVLLLKGPYQPVVHGPNLGLSVVDLNDGSYSATKIYPVKGIPGNTNRHKVIGKFYTQLDGDLCAYHVPGGSFAMRFIDGGDTVFVDDGHVGRNLRTNDIG